MLSLLWDTVVAASSCRYKLTAQSKRTRPDCQGKTKSPSPHLQ
jgi:hypothetical protein